VTAIALSRPAGGASGGVTILAARTGRSGGNSGTTTTTVADENHEHLREPLVAALRSGSLTSSGNALVLLQGLDGGAARYVPECLDRLGAYPHGATGANAREFDDAFRAIHGGGPDQSEARRMHPRWIADAWREWLASR
jgi:hypothetical protein